MDVATLSQVPRKTREKEAGGGGVTTQADRVQQCTAQGSSGKVGGAHGRRALRQWVHCFHRACFLLFSRF